MENKSLTYTTDNDKFKIFTGHIKDLSIIDPIIIIIFEKDYILMYSFVGKDLNNIHSFKSIILKPDELFIKYKVEEKITLIIKDGKRFLKNILNFNDYDEELKFRISYDASDMYINYIQISNSKLKIKEISGDPLVISKNTTIEDIKHLTNTNNSLLNFEIKRDEFKKIKRMSLIDINNDILELTINENNLFIGESKWELLICELKYNNLNVSFPKKYFNTLSATSNEVNKFYLFENYLLVSNSTSNLMIVLEMG